MNIPIPRFCHNGQCQASQHMRLVELYAKRNNGAFPTDLLEQGEGDFFGDDDDSFFDSKDDGFDF